MRTHQTDQSKVKDLLVVLDTQGEYVVGVKSKGKTVSLTTMHRSDEPPEKALDDKAVMAKVKPKKAED